MSTNISCHRVTDVNITLDGHWADLEITDSDGEKTDLTLFCGASRNAKDRQEETYLVLLQLHDRLGKSLKQLKKEMS